MRQIFLLALALCVLVVSAGARAQGGKVPRLGYLMDRSGPTAFDESFIQGLRDRGYFVGQNIVIEYRWTEGRTERLAAFATDLVARGVDVILTQGAASTLAAKRATATIPIVMASSQDAVADGLVENLARPGGNITGQTVYARELTAKRMELLKDSIPGLSQVGVLWNGAASGVPGQFQEAEAAAAKLSLALNSLEVRIPDGLESGMQRVAAAGVGAVLILSDSITIQYRQEIGAAALRARLPTMFANKAYLVRGGMMSYGPDIGENFRLAATQVDKILKGAKPADLPVQRPTTFQLVINLNTVKALGIAIPPSVLARADEVIE